MMKRIVLTVFIISGIIGSFNLFADPPEPSGRRLREITEDKYADDSVIIGGTTGSWAFGSNTGIILDREFSYVTPENDFKQWSIYPDNTSGFNWGPSDAWVSHIESNNQILRMHGPIGPQCSSWAQNDSRTPEELEENMCNFMEEMCKRYNGKPGFEYLDVVNETVVGGNWFTDKPGTGWENPWYKIGQDDDGNSTPLYISMAFDFAGMYAPDIKLIFNHHEDPSSTASWNLIKETIQYLWDMGLRVDGIGWQAHVDAGWESESRLNNLRNLIDWAHNNELEFHVTEASVWLPSTHTYDDYIDQARTYHSILKVLLEKRSAGVVGWNIWHIDDGYGWHTEWYPSLFDDVYKAKPAYYAVQRVLEDPEADFVNTDDITTDKIKISNYPNPFSETTTIAFTLTESAHVTIEIYNVISRRIDILVDEIKTAGDYEITWDGKNHSGQTMSSGVYFYRIKANNFSNTGKMTLLN
jgi:endo-1,4-beta-xylanase